MTTRTTEESRDEYISLLGASYGTAYYHGLQELWSTSSRWDIYETLFDNPEKVALLNGIDGYFWLHIQNTLFESVMLGLCRLTDPVKSAGRKNLTVRQFSELESLPQKQELIELVDVAVKATEVARDWRNRKLAHNDYDRITTNAEPLKGATRSATTNAIDAVHDVFAWVAMTHNQSHLSLTQLGDQHVQQVLGILHYGREFTEAKRKDRGWWSSAERRNALPTWLLERRPKRYRS